MGFFDRIRTAISGGYTRVRERFFSDSVEDKPITKKVKKSKWLIDEDGNENKNYYAKDYKFPVSYDEDEKPTKIPRRRKGSFDWLIPKSTETDEQFFKRTGDTDAARNLLPDESEFISVGRTDKDYDEWIISTGLISDGALSFASDYSDLFNLADS